MSTPGQSGALTQLAPALRPHLAELVDRTLKRITASIDSYRDESTMTVDELRSIIERNFVYLLERDPDTEDSATSPPRETGRLHARRGIPLPDALSAYRIVTAAGTALAPRLLERRLARGKGLAVSQYEGMTPERWQQVEEVLQGALDRPPQDRTSFLDEACAGVIRVRERIAPEPAARSLMDQRYQTYQLIYPALHQISGDQEFLQ